MSLLALVSSQRLTVSQSAFINQITASTLNVSSIGGGNLIGQTTINSTVQGLGSIGYVSSLSLLSTVIGLGSANYVSTASLVSTTTSVQTQFQTAGFLSSPTLVSTVAGLGTATYISSGQLISTTAGISALLGSALVTSNLTSTVGGIATSFSISSLTTSTLTKLTVFEGNPQIMLSGTSSGFSPAGTLIRISRNSGSSWGNISSGDFTGAAIGFAYNGRMWVAVGSGGASIKYSFDALNWSNAVGGFESQGQSVAWNGRMWVAVGSGSSSASTMRYSYDGINWQAGTNGFPGTGYSLAWGGNMWMAVGAESTVNNRIKYSFDGINWSNRVSGPTISFNTSYQNSQVVFGKNLWIAVGSANTTTECIQVSSDGSNWSAIQSGGFANCNAQAIAYNGNVFVAAGADTIQTRWSYNGLNWSNGTGVNYYTWYSVLYTGTMFYAVAQVSFQQTLRSFDGIFWDFATSPGNSLGFGLGFSSNSVLTYDQSNLQITGNNQYNVIGSWTSTSMIVPQYGTLNINDTLFVNRPTIRLGVNCNIPRYTVDVNGTLNTSTLFINTSNFTTILTSTVTGITAAGVPATIFTSNLLASTIAFVNVVPSTPALWVAVGYDNTQNNRFKYSFNGITWLNSLGSGFSTQGQDVAWNGRLWVAVGDESFSNNRVKYSGDGINWSNSAGVGFQSNAGYGIAWNGQMWVAVGGDFNTNNTIKYSFNGINWSNSAGPGFNNAFGYGVAWNGQMWVAVGADTTPNNTIKYSFNGINWSNSSGSGFTSQGYGVAWNGRMWVAVGTDSTSNNRIKYSFDGINWSNSLSGAFSTEGKRVAWNGTLWVAVGTDATSNNTIKYSLDGLNWSNTVGSGFTGNAHGVAWNGSLWVTTGYDSGGSGSIKYSSDGIRWSNATNVFGGHGYGVAFSSNLIPAYNQSNLNILSQNIPLFLTSTNTIFAQTSSMIINNTLEVDSILNRVGINCNVPQTTLDVNGQGFVSSITTNIISTLRVQASTIAVLNVPTLIFWADATKATTTNTLSVVSSMSNVFLGSNLIQSNGSANAAVVLPYTGSYMFEVSGWRCGPGTGTTGIIGTRGGTTFYSRVRSAAFADCSIFTASYFWNLFQAGDVMQFYKNENNGGLSPAGASVTNQNLPFNTGNDDTQGPIKVWYYGGSGNI